MFQPNQLPRPASFHEGAVAMRFLPLDDRPRERLLRQGAEALALWELIAILLGTGTKGKSAIGLARELLMHFKSLDGLLDASISELVAIKGMGKTKAVKLKAAFAIAQRSRKSYLSAKYRVDSAKRAFDLAKYEIGSQKQEMILVILRDARGDLIHFEKVGVGTLSEVLVHPREVFYPAVRHKAHSLIIAHNHPSGDPTPSNADLELTRMLLQSSRIMGITLADHVIVGREDFVSLREKGLMGSSKKY